MTARSSGRSRCGNEVVGRGGGMVHEGHELLAGKTVLVTAAAGTGIGFATAKRCAEEGAIVAISDRHERRLAESAAELAVVMGREPVAVQCDVTLEADVQR